MLHCYLWNRLSYLLTIQNRRVPELAQRGLPHAQPEERPAAQKVRLHQVRPEEGGGGRVRSLHPRPQQAAAQGHRRRRWIEAVVAVGRERSEDMVSKFEFFACLFTYVNLTCTVLLILWKVLPIFLCNLVQVYLPKPRYWCVCVFSRRIL